MHFINRTFRVCTIIILSFFSIIYLCVGCSDIKRNNSHRKISNSDIRKGRKLAKKYCQSCHALPDPELLDSKTWENGALPAMGPRLGIFEWNGVAYPFSRFDMNVGYYYPSEPLLKQEEWQNIINYYIATSPDTLHDTNPKQLAIKTALPLFVPEVPSYRPVNPGTSLAKIVGDGHSIGIITSDAATQTVFRFNGDLELIDSIRTRGSLVDVEVNGSSWLACNIGILNPNSGKHGSGRNITVSADNKMIEDSVVLFSGLQRPVQISQSDLNKDGKPDYLVSEFGYLTGALSWMENRGNGKYDRHVLRPQPGAVKSYFDDYNRDGLPDFWVLFSQGDVGVFLYTNKGQGKFEEKKVLGFPSVWGSSFFELLDFNKDGNLDIVYTCGDNADYSIVLKPYHGVYVFLNDGRNNFKQKFFFHINGCFKALARDYDNDGDIDIAAISFFADYKKNPEEGFVYLENSGHFNFTPYSLAETQKGRWLTMDAGDIDGDGKIDLILGNFSVGPAMMKSKFDWRQGPPFLVLKNTGKKN